MNPDRFTIKTQEALQAAQRLAEDRHNPQLVPEHLLAEGLRSGTLQRLPLAAGSSRNVSLQIVLARPDLLGPAGRAAVDAFHRHVQT